MLKLLEKRSELNYKNFSEPDYYHAFLYGEKFDVGGGTITKDEIDIIKEHPELERISIAGLHQDTFEYFIEKYAKQFKAIYFFKNKMVEDLSPLADLEEVEAIGYFVNQRSEKLWDMSRNKKLRMLNLDDFSRLHDLTGIERAPRLSGVEFGNKVWAKSYIETIPGLESSLLEHVGYNAQVSYEDVYKFLQCPKLEQLDFPTNAYKVEFLAWICANYSDVEGYSLKSHLMWDDYRGTICGKRKPSFDIQNEKDRKKVDNAIKKFEQMKARFKGMCFEEILEIVDDKK